MKRKSMLGLTFFILMGLAFGIIPEGRADCPDRVDCIVPVPIGEDVGHYTLGHINTPTCYRFLQGCRPWFCKENSHTNESYWNEECWRRFSNNYCTRDKACYADFPL